jgi:hypothetical protein
MSAIRWVTDELMTGTEGVQMYRYWGLADDGLFFVDAAPHATLRFLNFARQRADKIAEFPHALFYGPRAMSASPDGSSVVYTLQDVMLGDVFLIDGLRE